MPKTEMAQEELAQAIKEIIQENRDHGQLMKPIRSKCNDCKKMKPKACACSLYPNWIPDEVWDWVRDCEAFEQK